MTALTEAVFRVKETTQKGGGIRGYIESNYPDTFRALKMIDFENREPKRGKGYNLVKRENKKRGFLYYVRFYHEGKMLPTKWNTGTNRLDEAERFAVGNRANLIGRYLRSHDTRMWNLLGNFYAPQSGFTAGGDRRNRPLSERGRQEYHAVILNKFIPFLKKAGISGFGGITAESLSNFQDFLLEKGMKPQTANNNLKAVKRVLEYLERKGIIEQNPGDRLRGIPVYAGDREGRGCYELGRLKGVFDRRWKNEEAYLLCLLIYTTGMRNGEIRRIRMEDIPRIGGCRFIDIKESKTASGIRLVPLHDYVFRRLSAYASKKGKGNALFDFHNPGPFIRANLELARRLKAGGEELEKEHITFYSGRHYWKTLMNAEGLGEGVEEIFMGHRVTNDVAKLYNHRDKQGKKLMVKKARQVFAILDRRLFR